MRKFENIIQSDTAPQTNSLWLKDGVLKVFNNGKWTDISESNIQVYQQPDWNADPGSAKGILNRPFGTSRIFLGESTGMWEPSDDDNYLISLISRTSTGISDKYHLETVLQPGQAGILPTISTAIISDDYGTCVIYYKQQLSLLGSNVPTSRYDGRVVMFGQLKGKITYYYLVKSKNSVEATNYRLYEYVIDKIDPLYLPIEIMTQEEYDNASKDPDTIYFITEGIESSIRSTD